MKLKVPEKRMHIEVQAVDHESRVHLDIEADDIEAEVQRLEKLGAKRMKKVQTWVVMEAPTGQRFCVVRPQNKGFEQDANRWELTKAVASALFVKVCCIADLDEARLAIAAGASAIGLVSEMPSGPGPDSRGGRSRASPQAVPAPTRNLSADGALRRRSDCGSAATLRHDGRAARRRGH